MKNKLKLQRTLMTNAMLWFSLTPCLTSFAGQTSINGNWYYYYDSQKIEETSDFHSLTLHGSYSGWTKTYSPYGKIYYTSIEGEVLCPSSTFTIGDKTYPLCEIKTDGYGGCLNNIKKIIVPNGVVRVDLQRMYELEEVSLPESVLSFRINGCSKLKNITLPNNLKTLAGYHGWCLNSAPIESIEFPESVLDLGYGCLWESNIKDIYVPPTVQRAGGENFARCKALTNAYFNASGYLDLLTFSDCTALRRLKVGDAVIGICCGCWNEGTYSPVRGCTALENASFGVKISGTLPVRLFSDLKALKDVSFTGRVIGFSEYDFYNCYSLTNIESATPITSVGQYCFYNCQKLSNRVFDTSKCRTFGANACSKCYAFNDTLDLTSATSIGNSAFSECTNVKELDYRNKMTTIPQYGFSSCTSLTNVLFSSNLKSIGNYAFYRCSKLNNVVIPENVTYIGTNAFQSCAGLKKVFFNGKPPSATSAFTSIASNAHGYYLSRYKSEWLSVIDANGKWNGLIMEEQVAPVLEVSGASIPYDTLTLKWTYTSNDAVKYSLYRNTTDDLSSAVCIASGDEFNTRIRLLGNEYVENDFMKITPQTSSLHYWITAENLATGETAHDHVEARRRHLLSIGYSSYEHADTPMIQKYRNANLFRNSCRSNGDFSNPLFISDIDATTEKVREAMTNFAHRVRSGDLFVLYIDTHGKDYGVEDDASLSTYDDAYLSADLQADVRLFPASVAFIGIISACHSKALTGSVNQRNEINEWLAKWGFAQCLGNVAWIVSCDALQSSWTSTTGTYTEFGYSFIYDGLSRSCADRTLYGTEYKGGNGDWFITFGELARYAKEFSQGVSDAQPSVVQIENESLLDRIVATRRNSSPSYVVTRAPTSVDATKGEYESKVKITWNSVSGASYYKIYRTPKDNLNEKLWVAHSRSSIFAFDIDCALSAHYNYLVQAVGPTGKSELSEPDDNSIGWRGSDRLMKFMDNYRPSNMEAASYDEIESIVRENGYSLGASYIAGLDPTNETSKFTANITISNGVPSIVWTPDLGSSRTYTIYGKTDLTDANWTSPTNSSHRFFKVGVELPE